MPRKHQSHGKRGADGDLIATTGLEARSGPGLHRAQPAISDAFDGRDRALDPIGLPRTRLVPPGANRAEREAVRAL